VLALYFLPSIIARNHERAGAICVLNLFTGWSVVGWVAAFIWACTSPTLASPASVAEWNFNNEIPICRKLEGRIFKD
jgi:Superinfection immunity protein